MQTILCVCVCESLNSSVGIVTGLDGPGIGIRFPAWGKVFFRLGSAQTGCGSTQHSVQCMSRALSPGIMRPGGEALHFSMCQSRRASRQL
jgi:hypothetical protein